MQRVNVHRGSWTQTCLLVIDISLPVVLSRLQSLIAFPKVKRQVLLCDPEAKQPKDFTDNTMFWVNQEFGIMWVELFVSQLHSVLETSYSVFCKIMINVELFVKELLFLELLYWNLLSNISNKNIPKVKKKLKSLFYEYTSIIPCLSESDGKALLQPGDDCCNMLIYLAIFSG